MPVQTPDLSKTVAQEARPPSVGPAWASTKGAHRRARGPGPNLSGRLGHAAQQDVFDVLAPAPEARRARPVAPTWWQRAAGHQTLLALHHNLAQRPQSPQVWHARISAFEQHLSRLTLWQAAVWAATQLHDLFHPVRRLASWALFPSQNQTWTAADSLQIPAPFTAVPQCFITRDHAVLDGVLFKHPGVKKRQGPIVLVPPNGNAWESLTDVLALVAEQTGRDVLAFSYRKTSVSVGSVCGTSQAVVDTETVLQRAQQLADGAPFAVMGLSIGGGCGAAALLNLRKRHVLSATDVDAFAAVHSFSSLPATVTGLFPPLGKLVPRLLFGALRMVPLDSGAVLAQTATPVSRTIFVVNAQNDAVIRPSAALKVSEANQRKLQRRGVEVHQLNRVGAFHVDLSSFAEPRSWLQQLQQP